MAVERKAAEKMAEGKKLPREKMAEVKIAEEIKWPKEKMAEVEIAEENNGRGKNS